MRQNDLLKSDAGDHLRVLLYGEQQSYVVNCQRCKMPFPISTSSLLLMEKLPQDMYRLLALDEDISERQRQQRDRRLPEQTHRKVVRADHFQMRNVLSRCV